MSSGTSSNTTAEQAIKQFLSSNSGWHETQPLATATSYSIGHVRSTATVMAEEQNSPVQKRKNTRKPVVAYIFNGNWEFPGSDRQAYIRLIRMYANSPPSNLLSMSLSSLQSTLRSVADDTAVPEYKVEFRIP